MAPAGGIGAPSGTCSSFLAISRQFSFVQHVLEV